MRNDEKIDIQIGEPIPDDLPAVAKAKRLYATAHRYIEISKYMKKYEDRDKYLHRGIRYMKKCYPTLDVHAELRSLRLILFKERAEGRIALYEEAERILEDAKSEQDFAVAQDLFARIHKHEQTHSIPEDLISPELLERWKQCMDSEEKMQYCEQKKEEFITRNKKKTRITSGIILGLLVFAVIFSRTNTCTRLLGDVLTLTGNYDLANQEYSKLYAITGDESLIERQNHSHYLAAQKAIKEGDAKAALGKLVLCSQNDYKDSRELVLKMEKQELANADVGKEVSFGGDGGMKWYVLEKTDKEVLLLKKFALDVKGILGVTPGMTEPPVFDTKGGKNVTWETSSVRAWLNSDYINYKFSEVERGEIVHYQVKAEDNAVYGTSAGNDTVDQVFLLSASEYRKYSYLFHKTQTAWWTRTPGNEPGTMTYVDQFTNVMDYGYEVTNKAFSIKPVICVNFTE